MGGALEAWVNGDREGRREGGGGRRGEERRGEQRSSARKIVCSTCAIRLYTALPTHYLLLCLPFTNTHTTKHSNKDKLHSTNLALFPELSFKGKRACL